MPGAGSFPAGSGPCGLDPLSPPPPPRSVTPPAALRFDGQSQDLLLDSSGHYLAIHPIDQQVALALLIGLGTIGSAPTVGAAFRQITRITNATQTQATNMARAALAALVSAKKIQITDITVEVSLPQGATLIAVTYLNLVTSKTPTFTAPQGTFTGL
jgi:hypothetical protein